MLPEIAAEALHFLTRRDLDKASGVSKRLDAMIAHCCEVYPLRPVFTVQLYPCANNSTLKVFVYTDRDSHTCQSFGSIDEAVNFAGSILRRSFVHSLSLGASHLGSVTLSPGHWTTLVDAVRSGAVRHLRVSGTDLSALADDALLVAVCCRGLTMLEVYRNVLPGGFVTDDLIRASVAKGLHRLHVLENYSDPPHMFSEDAALDFFFRPEAASGGPPPKLLLDGVWLTDKFVAKFFEHLRSSPLRPSGWLSFYGGTSKQRGLSPYAHYLTSVHWQYSSYCLPSIVDEEKSCKFALVELSSCSYLECSFSW